MPSMCRISLVNSVVSYMRAFLVCTELGYALWKQFLRVNFRAKHSESRSLPSTDEAPQTARPGKTFLLKTETVKLAASTTLSKSHAHVLRCRLRLLVEMFFFFDFVICFLPEWFIYGPRKIKWKGGISCRLNAVSYSFFVFFFFNNHFYIISNLKITVGKIALEQIRSTHIAPFVIGVLRKNESRASAFSQNTVTRL